ncbi:hypothetical protein C8J57DRAFT_1618273 [Mycena rebaudengoi]|nr:hypothetical protein C8J57DRAFT_1618273 [Mycena rebaudengoi]
MERSLIPCPRRARGRGLRPRWDVGRARSSGRIASSFFEGRVPRVGSVPAAWRCSPCFDTSVSHCGGVGAFFLPSFLPSLPRHAPPRAPPPESAFFFHIIHSSLLSPPLTPSCSIRSTLALPSSLSSALPSKPSLIFESPSSPPSSCPLPLPPSPFAPILSLLLPPNFLPPPSPPCCRPVLFYHRASATPRSRGHAAFGFGPAAHRRVALALRLRCCDGGERLGLISLVFLLSPPLSSSFHSCLPPPTSSPSSHPFPRHLAPLPSADGSPAWGHIMETHRAHYGENVGARASGWGLAERTSPRVFS